MKRSIKLIIICAVIVIGCKAPPKEYFNTQSVTVAGHIESKTSDVVSIYFTDFVLEEYNYTQFVDEETNEFSFTFDISHSQDISLTYDEKRIILFVEPNDTLFLNFNAKDFGINSDGEFSSVRFSGNNSAANSDLLKFQLYREIQPFNSENTTRSVKQFLNALRVYVDNQNMELDSFIKEYQPSTKFVHWAKSDVKFSNANKLLRYQAKLNLNNLPRTDSLYPSDQFPISNMDGLLSSFFGFHVSNYAIDRYILSDSVVMAELSTGNIAKAYDLTCKSIHESESTELVQDIVIYKLFTWELNRQPDTFNDIIPKIDTYISNESLKANLLNKVNSGETISFSALNDSSNKQNQYINGVYDEILNISMTKTVYLDIWSTWCGPCIKSMPNLVELNEVLENRNATIVTLCLESEFLKWSALLNKDSIPGTHLFLNSTQSAIVKGNLSITAYPTYLLIRDGVVISNNAPKPSMHEEILSIIDKNAL